MQKTHILRFPLSALFVCLALAFATVGCGSDTSGTVVEGPDTVDVDATGQDAANDLLVDAQGDGHSKPDSTTDLDVGDLSSDSQPDGDTAVVECIPGCDAQQHRTCDTSTGSCVCEATYCDIDGECVADGTVGTTECQVCDSTANAEGWSLRQAGEVCRASVGGCDPNEACDGVSAECPQDSFSTSGPCDDANSCTHSDGCTPAKTCSGTAYACLTPGFCETITGATCDGLGGCVYPADVGATCDDSDDCTKNDVCTQQKGCAGSPYTCDAPGECQVTNVCDGTGNCIAQNQEDGTACSPDGNDCTLTACGQGACVVVGTSDGCFIDSACIGQGNRLAQVGDGSCQFCDHLTAWDNWTLLTSGTCDDGDVCTFTDTCGQTGACEGTPYQCGIQGICDGLGSCLCNDGFGGPTCEQCADGWTGYPNCVLCDMDGDGSWAIDPVCGGNDCDDQNPDVSPNADDRPDPEFMDINCDGYDGTLDNAILVSTFGADTIDCGSRLDPCFTLPVARYRSMVTGRRQIWIQAGAYTDGPGQVGPADAGLGVYGGYDTHWARGPANGGDPAWQTTISTEREFIIDVYNTHNITVSNLKLIGADATGTLHGSRNGKSSYVGRVVNSTATFEGLVIEQGDGAPGTVGADSPGGSGGSAGANGLEAIWWVTCPGFANTGGAGGASGCSGGSYGGTGGDVYCGFMGIHLFNSGGNGGGVCGDASCQWGPTGGGGGQVGGDTVGKDGETGYNGTAGQGGAGGSGGIVDQYGYYMGHSGTNGANGTNGVGGAGGGGGAGRSDWVVVAVSYAGGAGGGGGGAGCAPTSSGTGGGAGGSSIGLLLTDSTADVTNVEFIRGAGGAGATGGRGAAGGAGGAAGLGLSRGDGHGAKGGNGGNGGDGGASGGGGGGAGGDSVAIYTVNSPINALGLQVSQGTVGTGGSGGALAGTSSGADGEAGTLAEVVETTKSSGTPIPTVETTFPACDPELQECSCEADFYEQGDLCLTRGFVQLPVGTFTMGSPLAELGRVGETQVSTNTEAQHSVELTYVVEMQTNEVTQLEWAAAFEFDPSVFGPDWRDVIPLPECGPMCPVNMVNFYEALAYANWLSEKNGLTPCYVLSDCVGTPGDRSGGISSQTITYKCTVALNNVTIPQMCEGYRLPTEAEWEWATRAGTTTAYYGGDLVASEIDWGMNQVAWTKSNTTAFQLGGYSINVVEPTFQKRPNPWGLFDVSGNVAEWTWDYVTAYGGFITDPVTLVPGPFPETARIVRGGAAQFDASAARSAARGFGLSDSGAATPGFNVSFGSVVGLTGFRLVRTLYRQISE